MSELASGGAQDPVTAPGAGPAWVSRRPRFGVRALLAGWTLATAGLLAAAVLLPGLRLDGIVGAFGVAAVVGILNALIVPAIARIRLPFTVLSGFLVVLVLDAAVLWVAAQAIENSVSVDNFGWAFAGALVAAAATLVFQIALGVNNDDTYSLRVIERMAQTLGQAGAHRPAGHRLRRDRRPRLSRAAAGAPRRARSGDVPLARARARTSSSSGRPISRRRRARARRGSCSARTTTFPPSAGSRRTPAC